MVRTGAENVFVDNIPIERVNNQRNVFRAEQWRAYQGVPHMLAQLFANAPSTTTAPAGPAAPGVASHAAGAAEPTSGGPTQPAQPAAEPSTPRHRRTRAVSSPVASSDDPLNLAMMQQVAEATSPPVQTSPAGDSPADPAGQERAAKTARRAATSPTPAEIAADQITTDRLLEEIRSSVPAEAPAASAASTASEEVAQLARRMGEVGLEDDVIISPYLDSPSPSSGDRGRPAGAASRTDAGRPTQAADVAARSRSPRHLNYVAMAAPAPPPVRPRGSVARVLSTPPSSTPTEAKAGSSAAKAGSSAATAGSSAARATSQPERRGDMRPPARPEGRGRDAPAQPPSSSRASSRGSSSAGGQSRGSGRGQEPRPSRGGSRGGGRTESAPSGRGESRGTGGSGRTPTGRGDSRGGSASDRGTSSRGGARGGAGSSSERGRGRARGSGGR